MNKLSILALALLMFATVYTQEGSGRQAHFSMHFTLEHALNYDTSELNTPECETEQIFDGTIGALAEWVDVLSNPQDIQSDIDILAQVRLLIVSAQDSISKVEAGFIEATGQTSFVQLNSKSSVTLQTQVIHKVFADQMNYILNQLEVLNNQEGEPSELVQLAQTILDAIDALVAELEDLQNNTGNFPDYIVTLQGKVTEAQNIRGECHGSTVPGETQAQQTDARVSSATLDDFVYTPVTEVESVSGETTISNSPSNDNNTVDTSGQQFIANSGQLQFAQKTQRFLRLNKNKKNAKRLGRK